MGKKYILEYENSPLGGILDRQLFLATDEWKNKLATIQDVSNADQIILEKYIAHNLSTGVLSFGGFTRIDNTHIQIGAVKGYIINNYDNVSKPTVKYIEYAGDSYEINPNYDMTLFFINENGELVGVPAATSADTITPESSRDRIFLGIVSHTTGIIRSVMNKADYTQSPAAQIHDLWLAIRLINEGIMAFTSQDDFHLNFSAGFLWGNGINNDPQNPNRKSFNAVYDADLLYRDRNGNARVGRTDLKLVDPGYYDYNGVITPLTGVNKFTNQRIYIGPDGAIVIQYGQKAYQNKEDAIAGLPTESFTELNYNKEFGLLIGILTIQYDTDNWNIPSKYELRYVSRFGDTFGSSGGISAGTLQTIYNNSGLPHITTKIDTPFTLRNGDTNDTDKVLAIQNKLGIEVFSVDGNGLITGTLSGNVETATKLATARIFTITDNDATNSQASATGFDGSANFTVKLPSTIKASLTGTATNVTGTVAIANGGTGATTALAAFKALSPMTTVGDMIYAGGDFATGTRLAGNITTTRKFLLSVGNGTQAVAPSWSTLTKTDVGLSNVDNTSDANKPVSTATQTALDDLDATIGSIDIILDSILGVPPDYLATITFGTLTETINIGGVSASPVVNTRVNFLGTTEATSSDASASFAGGVNISKKLRVGGDITTSGNIIAANTTTQTDTIDFTNFAPQLSGTPWSYSAPTNKIRKYGNVVMIDFYATFSRGTQTPPIQAPSINIPTGFRPSYTMSRVSSSIDGVLTDITINGSTGEISFPFNTLGVGQTKTFRLYLTYIR